MNIAILVTDRCQASSIHLTLDLLIAANYIAKDNFGSDISVFNIELVGIKKKAQAYNQTFIDGIKPINLTTRPDILIIPSVFEAIIDEENALNCMRHHTTVVATIKAWHNKGTLLASACTGSFLLANSGLMGGRELTCHWASSALATKLFPAESFQTNKLLIDHGDIISAGGSSAIAQLILYIMSREYSRELALITAKIMLIEVNFEGQSRFAIFRPTHDHNDPLVLALQEQLESKVNSPFDLTLFAKQQALSEKQVVRRFKKITGETPLSYLQKVRIENVKMALESGAKSLNKTIWDVGYEDTTSFRRLFKKNTGLTMQEYRSRFSTLYA
ncbi:GlxA family transcriptional regulator [Paraglaciecola arctica]|uniref:GlxA family transcriptional regulator n=1 Tax=Paraglaciecola arctica TaxID=1128911 RepID=UPI001C067AD3|nr:helix-turn-helix domain-containing protein [Paraglaciecola arctica]MBU3002458.1 helix-turn-helix domain-containing protein [Paraglaciecola arctica]